MKNLIKDTVAHWNTHNATRMGAALSYYAMLSFVPLVFLLVTLASYLFSKDLVQGTLVTELASTVGRNAAQYIDELVRNQVFENVTLVTTIISVVITAVGAVGVFTELDQDFDILWDTPQSQKVHTTLWAKVAGYLHKKAIALSFIPLLVIVLLVVIIISIFFAAIHSTVAILPHFGLLISLVQIVAPLILGTALFAVMYRILPKRKLPWRILIVGALVTTALFIAGNYLVLEYIKLLVHTDVFGGAASLVGLLVWVYYSAQVFFLGASFTYVYAKEKHLIPSRDS